MDTESFVEVGVMACERELWECKVRATASHARERVWRARVGTCYTADRQQLRDSRVPHVVKLAL